MTAAFHIENNVTEGGRRDLSIMESSHAVIFQPSEYGYIHIKF